MAVAGLFDDDNCKWVALSTGSPLSGPRATCDCCNHGNKVRYCLLEICIYTSVKNSSTNSVLVVVVAVVIYYTVF